MPEQVKAFDFFELDQHRLDEEWVNQPRLYFEYAQKLADASKEVEQKKAELDLVYAERDAIVRSCPEEHGIVKVSEAAIKHTIIKSRKYIESQKALQEAEHKKDVLEAAVRALDHRKKALENLVQLFLANYFSSPRSPKGSQEQVQEMERKQAFKGKPKKEAAE
jgi:hypothetical protein